MSTAKDLNKTLKAIMSVTGNKPGFVQSPIYVKSLDSSRKQCRQHLLIGHSHSEGSQTEVYDGVNEYIFRLPGIFLCFHSSQDFASYKRAPISF